MCGVYPTADAKTAGNEISSTYEGRHITLLESELIHPKRDSGFVEKGDPVCAFAPLTGGVSVGVAFNGGVEADLIAIDTEGIWNLNVWSYDDDGGSDINHGDQLFIDFSHTDDLIVAGAGSCAISKISNTNTNIPFGYALGYVAASGDGNIAVKVHFDPPDNWLCDEEELLFGNAKDVSLIYSGDEGHSGILCASVWTVPGATGRPFESRLTTNALLGGYANALKGYVDLQTKGGATGLLSASCHEVLMATAGIAGTIAAVEMEIVYGATCGALPKPAFMWVNTDGTAKGDFDTYGDLLKIGDHITAGAGLMLSKDSNTLRVGTGALQAVKRYLPLSLTENILDYNVAALAVNGRIAKFTGGIATPLMPDGQGLFEIDITLTGTAGGSMMATSTWINLMDATAKLSADGNYGLHCDGFYTAATARLTDANLCIGRYSMILGTSDYTSLCLWQLNFTQTVTSIFDVNDRAAACGYEAGGCTTDTPIGTIPLVATNGVDPLYVYVYGVRT